MATLICSKHGRTENPINGSCPGCIMDDVVEREKQHQKAAGEESNSTHLLSAGWLIEWTRKGQYKSLYVEHKSKMIQQHGLFKAAQYKKLKATELFRKSGT